MKRRTNLPFFKDTVVSGKIKHFIFLLYDDVCVCVYAILLYLNSEGLHKTKRAPATLAVEFPGCPAAGTKQKRGMRCMISLLFG